LAVLAVPTSMFAANRRSILDVQLAHGKALLTGNAGG
jgi:hypothetical protein